MAHSALKEVLDSGLLVGRDWFVAGGYAADPELASDVDVWLTAADVEEAIHLHAHMQKYLESAGFEFEPQDILAAPEFIEQDELTDNCGNPLYGVIYKIAVVTSWRGIQFAKPIHLLVTTASVQDVLNGSDISTHAIALLPNGQYVYGDSWTPRTADPVIVKDTPTTPERFVKIKNRYRGYREGRQSVFASVGV